MAMNNTDSKQMVAASRGLVKRDLLLDKHSGLEFAEKQDSLHRRFCVKPGTCGFCALPYKLTCHLQAVLDLLLASHSNTRCFVLAFLAAAIAFSPIPNSPIRAGDGTICHQANAESIVKDLQST